MSKTTTLALLVLFAAVLAGSPGSAFDFADVSFWVGSGSNSAGLVIDWNDGVSPDALAWGFRWDGVATGADMLAAVDAADDLLAVDGTVSQFGLFIDAISWGPHNQATPPDWSQSWGYFTSDGAPTPTWASSFVGASVRTLANNSWDGWSFTAYDEFYNPVTPPGDPTVAVPEPGGLPALLSGLMALGGVVICRRSR